MAKVKRCATLGCMLSVEHSGDYCGQCWYFLETAKKRLAVLLTNNCVNLTQQEQQTLFRVLEHCVMLQRPIIVNGRDAAANMSLAEHFDWLTEQMKGTNE